MNCLSASILAADFTRLGEMIAEADNAGCQYIHYDVMDGMFVPNISFGIPVLKSIRSCTDKIFDVHLMIEQPEKYIADFADAGADIITIHAEACKHIDACVADIKSKGMMAGVALNPATPISVIEDILPQLDMVLIMTVNPGFGGQKLIKYTLDKVRRLREIINKRGLKTDIEIDGGATLDNVEEILDAGANIIVAGSAVFGGNITDNVESFINILNA